MSESNPMTLLLVEDDDIDVMAIQRALDRLGFDGTLLVAGSIREAKDVLAGATHAIDLVLLDVNLPGGSGSEFLEARRTDARLQRPPVIVHTSSNDRRDLERCFAAGAAGYFVKSLDEPAVERTLRVILEYWRTSCLPTTSRV